MSWSTSTTVTLDTNQYFVVHRAPHESVDEYRNRVHIEAENALGFRGPGLDFSTLAGRKWREISECGFETREYTHTGQGPCNRWTSRQLPRTRPA